MFVPRLFLIFFLTRVENTIKNRFLDYRIDIGQLPAEITNIIQFFQTTNN